MEALTMSMDKDACRYAAAVQTNGYRTEVIAISKLRQAWVIANTNEAKVLPVRNCHVGVRKRP